MTNKQILYIGIVIAIAVGPGANFAVNLMKLLANMFGIG